MQRSWSPTTPVRKASIREKPDGTGSPLTSPATRPLVSMPDTASSRSPAVNAMVLPSGVVTSWDSLVVATPVRHAVRSPDSALSIVKPPCCCSIASMKREVSTEYAVLSPETSPVLPPPSDGVPNFCSPGRSMAMVLVAGQYDAGGLGRAPEHDDAEPASKLSCGGLAGENSIVSASTMALTDS